MDQRRVKCHVKTDQTKGDYILYWMQHTQRTQDNEALILAIKAANQYDLPLKVVFNLVDDYPEANARHYAFMLEGLYAMNTAFYDAGIDFTVTVGAFETSLEPFIKKARVFYTDKGYTKYLRALRSNIIKLAKKANITTFEVETDVIVPVEIASNKLEYAARTIRPKLLKLKDDFIYLNDTPKLKNKKGAKAKLLEKDIDDLLATLNVDQSVSKTPYFKGGEQAAFEQLDEFLNHALKDYQDSNDMGRDLTSKMSPYLHFGMISPVRLYLSVSDFLDTYPSASVEGYLEQVFIRRELAFNFVYYHNGYDAFDKMTHEWAYETMEVHLGDQREYLYTEEDYLAFNTHDEYFNAAMKEMVYTGYMHNYMRMYWGKKIIEWSSDYETAYETIKILNNRYFLDGRDPNSYAGIAWCFGRHDHGWKDRAVFGKIRYMNAAGLKRKFDIDAYVKRVNKLKK